MGNDDGWRVGEVDSVLAYLDSLFHFIIPESFNSNSTQSRETFSAKKSWRLGPNFPPISPHRIVGQSYLLLCSKSVAFSVAEGVTVQGLLDCESCPVFWLSVSGKLSSSAKSLW